MATPKKWDIFISHAFEDKGFVKRLVEKLRELEIDVWYDEFVLKAGDSISASIDLGVNNSQFGLAVFSEVYFKKFWTREEIAGLRAREPLFGRIIIPVWLNIDKRGVTEFSPVLADRLAIITNGRNSRHVATEVAKVVKPDALNRWHIRSTFKKSMKDAIRSELDPRGLKKSPHRHKTLNLHQLSRIRLLHAATEDVYRVSYDSWIDDFRRDLYPDQEIIWWERLVAAYLAMLNSGLIEPTLDNKKNLYSSMLIAANGQPEPLVSWLSALPGTIADKLAEIATQFFTLPDDDRLDRPENLSYRPEVG